MTHNREPGLYCLPLKGKVFCSSRQLNYHRILLNMPGLNLVLLELFYFSFVFTPQIWTFGVSTECLKFLTILLYGGYPKLQCFPALHRLWYSALRPMAALC